MQRTTRRILCCALALVAAGTLAGCELGEPAPYRLASGHVDAFGVAVEDGELFVHIHDEEADEERLPGEVLLQALPESKTQVPNDPAFAFLGAPGSDTWVLPQVQDPDLLWPGLGTEEIEPGTLVGDELTWSFDDIYGPGDLALYTTDQFGVPDVLLNSGDGLGDSVVVPAGAHEHMNWAFSAPGRYVVAFRATATLAETGEVLDSGPVYYHFVVDDYSCADVDDATPASAAVSTGAAFDVSYDLSNCGSVDGSFTVSALVEAPEACGGATTVVALRTEDLAPGASGAHTDSLTAPTCAGEHTVTVQVTAGADTESFGSQFALAVS